MDEDVEIKILPVRSSLLTHNSKTVASNSGLILRRLPVEAPFLRIHLSSNSAVISWSILSSLNVKERKKGDMCTCHDSTQ